MQERYLSPNTRLVVQKPGNAPRWYTTQKEVVVEGEPAVTVCPFTNEPVRMIVKDGFRVFFPPNLVRTREILTDDEIDPAKLASFKPLTLAYYIPETATETLPNGRVIKFRNPSNQLRRFAIRIDGSVWLMDQEDVPQALVAKMLDAGCRPFPLKIDVSESKRLIGVAIGSLREQIAEQIAAAEKSQRDAEAQLLNAMNEEGLTEEQARDRYVQRANAIAARLASLTEDLNAVAARFGLNPDSFNLSRLTDVKDVLTTAMAARAATYMDGVKALRAVGTSSATAMAAAAEKEAIPVEIMADMLRDEGRDEAADALLAGFRDEPVTVPADDGVFSLTDLD